VTVLNQLNTIRSREMFRLLQIAEMDLRAAVTAWVGLLAVNPVSRVWTSSSGGLDRVGDRWVASASAADLGWELGWDMLCRRGGARVASKGQEARHRVHLVEGASRGVRLRLVRGVARGLSGSATTVRSAVVYACRSLFPVVADFRRTRQACRSSSRCRRWVDCVRASESKSSGAAEGWWQQATRSALVE
jgi:hypothetical protein